MPKHRPNRFLATSALSVLTILGCLLAAPAARAQSASGTQVGTFNPQEVAKAIGFETQMKAALQPLQARMMKAQQDQDMDAMNQIRTEAQKLQQDAAEKFRNDLHGAMPEVGEQTGVKVIAPQVTWAATGFEVIDVTQKVIDVLKAKGIGAPAADAPASGSGD